MSLDSQDLKRMLRKRESTDDTDAEGSWAISYGDMITLLLTFFILFFNVNNKKSEQKEQLQKAIMTEFGLEKGSAKDETTKDTPRIFMSLQKDGELEANTLKEWGGTLHRDGDKVVIEFPNTTFFDLGKVDVKEKSLKVLQLFANKYVKFAGSNSLSIKAFTDSVPVSKSQRYHDNLELSALRAIAAMRVLQHSGIPLDRMKISGHGETLTRKPSSETAVTGTDKAPDEFARKVILVIEPFTKEKL